MPESVQLIIIALFALVLLYLPLVSRRLDRLRMHAEMYMREMEPDLAAWVEQAEALVALEDGEPSLLEEYHGLLDRFRKAKKRKPEEIVPVVNEIHALVQKTEKRCRDMEQAAELRTRLCGIYSDFAVMAGNYNHNAEQIGTELEKGMTALYRRIFRVRPLPVLDNLSEFSN